METMYAGSAIPIEWVEAFQGKIKDYVILYKDNMVARNLLARRNLPSYVDIDVFLRYKDTGPGAQIVAKGAVPDTIGSVAETEKHSVFQFATSFIVNEKDLEKDPEIQTRNVDIGMRYLHRLEDEVALTGSSTYGITGLLTIADNNPNGKITASGATGSDANNFGAWAGTETDGAMDPYEDVLNALTRIGDNFGNSPLFLLGRKSQMMGMFRKDSERNSFVNDIAALLRGNENSRDWMVFSDYVTSGYVYLVAKDPLFAEIVHAQDVVVDTNYPRQPGGNYRVEMREWIAPIEQHATDGIVEIAIT